MSERKLKSRKKKASKGKSIRVSDLVYETLNKSRHGRSWDNILRKMLGLPDRAGNDQILIEGMLEVMTGKFFLKTPGQSWEKIEEDAYEISILTAAKFNSKRISKPLKMRELP